MLVDPIGFVIVCAVCAGLGFVIGWIGGAAEVKMYRAAWIRVCMRHAPPECQGKDPSGCWNVRCQLGGACCRADGVLGNDGSQP